MKNKMRPKARKNWLVLRVFAKSQLKIFFFFTFSLLLFIQSHVFAANLASIKIKPEVLKLGDAVFATINSQIAPISATFGGEPISIFQYKNLPRVIFGISPSKPSGVYNLRINFTDGSQIVNPLKIQSKKFPRLYLDIPEKLKIKPGTLASKLSENNKKITKVAQSSSPKSYFTEGFALPLVDNRRLTSVFGETRMTGGEEIRHNGLDLGAAKGASVAAINDGVVSRAYFDDIYGNSIIIDHGAGIISLYMHLDKILVKEGEKVRKGTLIGRVGSTGYAEYPHLHFGIKISGTPVDPLSFVGLF